MIMAKKNYARPISFLLIIATIFYAFYSQMPKFKKDFNAPSTEFSTERSLDHLAVIARKPHYVGTPEHTKVRDYIIQELKKLDLEVSVQEQEAVNSKWNAGTKTYNILTRIKGLNSNKALMLLTHYDSSPHSSYGGSDAGSGVVSILEGVRAYIASGKKPKNDIIILITDAEELGLLGAKAFVNHHPWASEVGLVINLEARGSGGPSYMLLETNGGNHKFIQEFNNANSPYPVGNSLMYSIYKMLPNDTDLTVFREDGDIDGFNFAFIDDHFDYHSAQDNAERLDRNTLAHQGSYVMSLLNYFSDSDLTQLKGKTDDVFFNFSGFGTIYYPFTSVLPVIIIVSVIFLVLFLQGVRKQKLTLKGSLTSFVPFLFLVVLAGIIGFVGWNLILFLFPHYADILHGFPYNGHLYIITFVSLIIGLSFWIYRYYFKKGAIPDLMIAPLVIWIVINYLIAFKLQGGGFFIIPLLGLLISWGILLFTNDSPRKRIWLFTLLAIPTLLLFSPLVKMFPVGLGLKAIGVSLVLVTLLFGSLLGVFGFYSNTKHLAKLFFGVAFIAFIAAYFKSEYSIDRKLPNSIIFLQDIDNNEAFWASYNRENDSFTEQFLGTNPQEGDLSLFFSSKFKTKFNFYKKTAIKDIPKPVIQKSINDSLYADRDVYEYLIKPQRDSNVLYIIAKDSIAFHAISFNGEAFNKRDNTSKFIFTTTKDNNKIISYYLAEGVDSLTVKMEVPKNIIPNLELYDISFDLLNHPLFHVKPRSKTMMPTPFVVNDAIILKMKL
jgi:hypothetical protein